MTRSRFVKANFVNTSCHYAEPPEHGIFVIHMHVHAVSPICISLSLALCMHAYSLSLLLILTCLKEALISLANPL